MGSMCGHGDLHGEAKAAEARAAGRGHEATARALSGIAAMIAALEREERLERAGRAGVELGR